MPNHEVRIGACKSADLPFLTAVFLDAETGELLYETTYEASSAEFFPECLAFTQRGILPRHCSVCKSPADHCDCHDDDRNIIGGE